MAVNWVLRWPWSQLQRRRFFRVRTQSAGQLTSFSIWLYDSHSSSRVSATTSTFSIFFSRLRPSDRMCRLSMPERLLIFSMLLVDSARCLSMVAAAGRLVWHAPAAVLLYG